VPPPPAGGGAVGNELDVLEDGSGCGVEKVAEGPGDDGLGLPSALGLVPLPGLVLALGVVLGAVPLAVPVGSVGPTDPDTVTDGMVGDVVDVPPVHAVIAVEASMASAPAPASLAVSAIPAKVMRPLIEPPHPPAAVVRFPAMASQTRLRKENARPIRPLLEGRFPKVQATI
jgi:hypothetical protein